MSKPQERSLKSLREDGWIAEGVEKWKAFYGENPLIAKIREVLDFIKAANGNGQNFNLASVETSLLRIVENSKSCPTGAGVRSDLFGWCDILACKPGIGFLGVQTTSSGHQAERVQKIIANDNARVWIQSGGHIRVHGWRKKKLKPGGKAMRWVCNVIPVTPDDVAAFENF